MMNLAELLPHAGAALLIENVERWDEALIIATTGTHRSPHNPLRRAGRLHAVHVVEYAAQVMALHGALRDRATGASSGTSTGAAARPVLLVSVRDLALAREYLDDLPGALVISARPELQTADGFGYAFEVEHAHVRIASGALAAMAAAL